MESGTRLFGLIGYPLSHSFSKKYFTEKFAQEGIQNASYELYPLKDIKELLELLKTKNLVGLNVTIPYKLDVLPFLDELDETTSARIGAVNTIKIYPDGSTKGFNTDYYGFKNSLEEWIDHRGDGVKQLKALVLGNGGAAKAVLAALSDLNTPYQVVSRQRSATTISYDDLDEDMMATHRLIVNTTPLGMAPNYESAPPIPYELLTPGHYLYDLVYNPEETLFLKKGAEKGAATLNGLKMLYLQAEKSWSFWNEEDLPE
jgi:shikimate dehydrogenase